MIAIRIITFSKLGIFDADRILDVFVPKVVSDFVNEFEVSIIECLMTIGDKGSFIAEKFS